MTPRRVLEPGSVAARAALVATISVLALLMPAQVEAATQVPTAAARVPLPSDRLHFGIANSPAMAEVDWFVASQVPWRYRYQYIAGGVNTGGTPGDPCGANAGWQTWNSPAGEFATLYINDSIAKSAIPVFSYYEIVQSNPSPGNESALLTKISNVCTMQAYWADFTVLMKKVGASGTQVVVQVEPDFWGFMELQSADPTTIPAVVASSNNADLAGLPNTVQGMGWAFLKLRDKYAPNALLAVHASSWASNVDIATDQRTTVDPAAEADKVISFLNKVGLVGNPTGVTPWDVIFNDVADHDAAWYGAASNTHWWDRNNVLFPNFSRWLAFMSRMHTVTGLPLVVWQVPVGNQYYQTMNNTDGHYQDNRAEYFLAHPGELTGAGIVAVLFGKANGGQTTYWDYKADGVTNPALVSSWQCNGCNTHVSTYADDDGGFLRVFVGAYYRGVAVVPCTSVTLTTSPTSVTNGTHVTATAAASGCPSPRYEFWLRPANSTAWQVVQTYGTSATYDWNSTGSAPGTVYLGVHARDASSGAPYDAVASAPVTVTGSSCTGPMVTGLTISTAPTSVLQGSGAHVTAAASYCAASPRYEFWLRPASSSTWLMVQSYGASATYDWNSMGAAPGTVYLGVRAKDATSTSAYDGAASTPVTVTPVTCASVTISAAPTTVVHSSSGGTHVTVTAAASGCTTTPIYEFWLRPASSSTWLLVRSYAAGTTYDWNSTGAAPGTVYFGIHVRDANSSASYDTVASSPVTVT